MTYGMAHDLGLKRDVVRALSPAQFDGIRANLVKLDYGANSKQLFNRFGNANVKKVCAFACMHVRLVIVRVRLVHAHVSTHAHARICAHAQALVCACVCASASMLHGGAHAHTHMGVHMHTHTQG